MVSGIAASGRWRDSRYDAVWIEAYKANYAKTLPAGMKLGDTAYIVVPYVASPALRASKPYNIIDITAYYNGENTYGALQIYPTTTKYHDKYRDAINSGTGTRDVYEIRLAEMYLIACEAIYMQPGRAAEALPFINEVRKRAAKPGHINDMLATVSDLSIDFILNERALELGAERYRWIDLKRTGKLIERVKLYNRQVELVFQKSFYCGLFPVILQTVLLIKLIFRKIQVTRFCVLNFYLTPSDPPLPSERGKITNSFSSPSPLGEGFRVRLISEVCEFMRPNEEIIDYQVP